MKPYDFDWRRIFAEDGYHIEYSVTDACNRNCASCSHLAPLAKRPNFVSVGEFTRVVKTVHELIPDAHTFWLTGGEPTLHPDFMQLLRILRSIRKDGYIGVYSNGTTLPARARDEEFWRFMRDGGVVWAITNYDTPREYFERLFDGHGCGDNLAVIRSGKTFMKLTNYSRGQPVSEEKYAACGWERSKINIRNGRIYNCPSAEFADLFNGYFGEDLRVTAADYLTVDGELTRRKIDEFRGPTPFCGQCDPSKRLGKIFGNVPSRKDKSEWSEL